MCRRCFLLLLWFSLSSGLFSMGRQEEIPLEEHMEARYTANRPRFSSSFPPEMNREKYGYFQSLFHSLRNWIPQDSKYIKVQASSDRGERYSVSSSRGTYSVQPPSNREKHSSCPSLPSNPTCSSTSYNQCKYSGKLSKDCSQKSMCCFNGCENVCLPDPRTHPTVKTTEPNGNDRKPDQSIQNKRRPINRPGSTPLREMQLPKTAVFTRTTAFHRQDKKEDNNPSRTPAYVPLHLDKYADKPQKQSSKVQHQKISQQKRPFVKLPLVHTSTVLQDSVKQSTQKPYQVNEGKKKHKNLADNLYALTKPTNKPLKTGATFPSSSRLKRKPQQNLVALPLPQEEYQYIDFSPSLPSPTSPSPSFLCPSPLPSRRSFPSHCIGHSDACWVPGEPDISCPDFGFCCFDGCANTCLSPTNTTEPTVEASHTLFKETLLPPSQIPSKKWNQAQITPVEQLGINVPKDLQIIAEQASSQHGNSWLAEDLSVELTKSPVAKPHLMVVPWKTHFSRFPILAQPIFSNQNNKRQTSSSTQSTITVTSSCPSVQQRTAEDCRLDYRHHCNQPGKQDRLCPYDDICCWDGCANRCLNFRPPDSVFFRESVGVFVNK